VFSSLALDSSGHPMIRYFDVSNGDLKVLHCSSPDCAQENGANPNVIKLTKSG
jgi:hypothetical protein